MESHFVKHDLILLFKIIHELVPVKLPIEIVPCISRTKARRDNAPTFKVHDEIGAVKRVFSNSFFVRSISQWNRLPSNLRSVTNLDDFINALDLHLWAQISREITVLIDHIPVSEREPD